MDTIVDPVEMIPSSGHLEIAPPVRPPGPRASFPSLEPDAQVQWFERVFTDEPTSSVDVEVAWEEELDTAPTLVLRRRPM